MKANTSVLQARCCIVVTAGERSERLTGGTFN
jgi:hypothetical protein